MTVDPVCYHGVTTGLERYRLPCNALTQTRLGGVDLSTALLGKRRLAHLIEELRICLHTCGAADVAALRRIGVAAMR